MSDQLPGFSFIDENCRGHLACMRACPTHAIRVRNGKAKVNPKLCIACSECILACPENAFKTHMDTWEDMDKFKYRVAVPSPTLFGQFPLDVSPSDIVRGLLDIGFDAVYDTGIEFELVNMAIRDYLDESKGPWPLISSSCPVVVRLVQVSYPEMVGQIIPIEPPREISGREVKKIHAKKTGLSEDDIGAIYITPCMAKMVSIKQPAENVKSYLDLALSISEVFNKILSAITKRKKSPQESNPGDDFKLQTDMGLNWVLTGGQSVSLKQSSYLSVVGIANIIRIFDDIEKGKIKGIDFLECYNCLGGCIGGPLTVSDRFVARSKVLRLISEHQIDKVDIEEGMKKRYVKGDYMLRQPLKPRVLESEDISLAEKIKRVRLRDELVTRLPGLSCGLCGAPSCAAFAQDIANGVSEITDCIFLATDRMDILRKVYGF